MSAPNRTGHPTTDDLQRGDLLFFARPSIIQWFCDRVDDPYRGIGIVEVVGGRAFALYCGRSGVERMEVEQMLAGGRYTEVAVVRLTGGVDLDRVLAWVHDQRRRSIHYPTLSLVPAFFLSAVRTRDSPARSVARAVLAPLFGAWAELHRLLIDESGVFICSTFIAAALQQGQCTRGDRDGADEADRGLAGGLGISLLDPKSSAGCRPTNALDRALARLLLTPSDIWRALSAERCWILHHAPATPTVADRLRSRGNLALSYLNEATRYPRSPRASGPRLPGWRSLIRSVTRQGVP